jgi:LAO/AO transport system kinase
LPSLKKLMANKELKLLLEKFLAGDSRALSRLITLAENRNDEIPKILKEIYPKTGSAKIFGITGPPGAGKSTLINYFIRRLREKKKKVAVVAVDPMSPFTGGSLLGDRIRLIEHFNDPEVFIRSLSTRGKLGGLSLATTETVHLLDAFGFDTILVETVGVGQSEVDIQKLADLSIVVLVPESGDAIQALKAGILEIADIFVVNKSEREGADRVANDLKQILELSGKDTGNVFLTTAKEPSSVEKLFQHMEAYWEGNPSLVKSRKAARIKDTIRDWTFEIAKAEASRWIDKHVKKAKNPYEWVVAFQKKHREGKWSR